MRRRPNGIRAPISTISGKTEKHGFRVEVYEPANRACPTCPERWIGPGTMDHLAIEACARCRAVVPKRKYVKKTTPRVVKPRKRYVSKGEQRV